METETQFHHGTYSFINLGCPKNLVDAEYVAARLEEAGYRESPVSEEASLIVVTTCAFISSAMEESVEEILRAGAAKKPGQLLAVLGCLVSREGASLKKLLPEVDLFCDVREMQLLPEKLAALSGEGRERGGESLIPSTRRRDASCPRGAAARKRFTPGHLAYLKIADGCSNRCSYCMIPSIRGDLESRSREDVIAEAAGLAVSGVKELVVVAQDTTAWGFDRGRGESLYDLLEGLADATRFDWIRLMYLHPAHIDLNRLLPLIKGGALVPYLDVPIQHASDAILKRMGRGYGKKDLQTLFERLRGSLDDLVMRTTVMVGFPGETDRDFRELADFIEEVSFDHIGVFTYSAERGTAAQRFRTGVPERTALERRDELLDIQMDISQERLSARVGTEIEILIDAALSADERPHPSLVWIGRYYGQAYEVDGVTYLRGAVAGPGSLVGARVQEAQAYDLVADVTRG